MYLYISRQTLSSLCPGLLNVSLFLYQTAKSSTMHSIVAFLSVLIGVAIANPMVISSDDVNQQNRDISAKEYLRKIFQNSVMHYDSLVDVSSQDDLIDDLVAMLPALGLYEASDIARRVDLKQMIKDSDLTSLTLCLPNDKAVLKWRQQLPIELKPEALKQLVKAWIVPGMIRSSVVTHNMMVQSLNGVKLRFNVYKNMQNGKMQKTITVNGARIIDADKITSTGIIHVVDKVIYPLPVGNVLQTLDDVEAFSVIVDLLKQAGLSQALEVTDPITVLVPTKAAFQALPSGVLEDLKRNKTKLQNLLKYHVISDVRYSASLLSGQHITALQGDEISVSIENGKVLLNQERAQSAASVIQADIPTTNGVIHVIDHVLVPAQKHYVLV